MRLSRTERLAIGEYLTTLTSSVPEVEKVILFGSKARGSGRPLSRRDTDLAVILTSRRSSKLRISVVEPTFGPIAKFGVDLSPVLISSSAFRKPSPFISRLKEEGIELWNRRKGSLLPAA